VTGGVHTAADAIRAIMAGAHGVQMVSALLKKGEHHLREVREELVAWLESHEYESIGQMCGSMSLMRSPDPGAFERANYVHILQSWRK
jgi:dihydroorotate dehydrogenase (fumarate)